ncbi:MmpS family transport accessory protein [Micromonospora sp. 4G55]|uniref:MmpS family transport accessory protein n=1 Tax=Micromonospora sp. 4G55 TaxID=2806102 RepID=UPI001A419935|nr:MmpS family transport accessory protein [Micromonospora sp. 4G55]MBM0260850.1 hypothetical protein [Micromonospora sp. 4G55]
MGIVIAVVAVLVLGVCGCVGVGSALVGRYSPTADEPYYDPDPYYSDDYDEDAPESTWSPPPPVQPSTPAATPSRGRGRFAVTYEVTGQGTADVQYYDANGDFIRLDGVRLPWRKKIRTDDANRVIVIASKTDNDGRTIGCSTTVAGRAPVTDSVDGWGWQVTCAGR